jgi:hypothetical protein
METKLGDLEQKELDATSSLNDWKQQCLNLEEDMCRIQKELENENKLRVETESRIVSFKTILIFCPCNN